MSLNKIVTWSELYFTRTTLAGSLGTNLIGQSSQDKLMGVNGLLE